MRNICNVYKSGELARYFDDFALVDEKLFEETKQYVTKILTRLTVLGATFLVIIAGLPILFSQVTSLPTSVTIGGTGLLIVVGVVLETYKQIEGSILARSYKRGYSRR